VFVNPESPSAKAKLRLLYEVAPIGFLMEKAGGKSSYGAGSVLDLKVQKTEDRTQVSKRTRGLARRNG
jgi:sedoheptulose-bisphosphatase